MRSSQSRRSTLAVGVLIASLGCDHARNGSGQLGVRDSSGVEIVEYGAVPPKNVERWTLEPKPVVTIGKSDGTGPDLFSGVRYVGRFKTGEIAVLDWQSNEFRVFDSTGGFVRKFGGTGDGPGEFRGPQLIRLRSNDSIAVYDMTHFRMSLFARDGRLKREASWANVPGMVFSLVYDELSDGTFLISIDRGVDPSSATDMARLPNGPYRDTLRPMLVATDGRPGPSIGPFLGDDACRVSWPGTIAGCDRPFGVEKAIAAVDTLVYVGTGTRYEIKGYDRGGRLVRIIRVHRAPTPVADDAIAQWRRQLAERYARRDQQVSPDQTTQRLRAENAKYLAFPKDYPAHGMIVGDQVGNLWVSDYRPFPESADSSTWTVFGPNGRMLAVAHLLGSPGWGDRFRITQLGPDFVAGAEQGDDDIPRAVVYRVVRR